MTFVSHLKRIVDWLTKAVSEKYQRGQAEHGGSLWQKAGMLAHAESEALNLVVYLPTLRDQLTDVLHELSEQHYMEAEHNLRRILGAPED